MYKVVIRRAHTHAYRILVFARLSFAAAGELLSGWIGDKTGGRARSVSSLR
jgi:hypothetical protein